MAERRSSHMLSRRVGFFLTGLAFASIVHATPARADRIVLRGGGQVRGKVVPGADPKGRVVVLTERGKTPLSFAKAQVVEVVPEASALDGYLAEREAAPATAVGQQALGLWCERHKLPDLASVHYEAAVRYDKGFAPAHQKLGHVLHGDQWLNADELREAQGLVKHKGKWITREEQGVLEKNKESAAEESSWMRRVRLLREAVVYGADDRRREAESQLMEIREAAAVRPLMRVLGGDDSGALRTLLARVLAVIPGPESASALVSLLLAETEADVRHETMNELERRKDAAIVKQLVRGLKNEAPEVVNRAAWALANLRAVATVPNLVGALVSVRTEVVMAPTTGGSPGGMNIGANFGVPAPIPYPYAAPIAYNGSSVGYLTPPAVGPGVVAYGAVGVPLYNLPNPVGNMPEFGTTPANTGINAGGGLLGSRGPIPTQVSVPIKNTEVLSALVKLTGQDFGYDVAAWRRWLRTSFEADPEPVRKVPQP